MPIVANMRTAWIVAVTVHIIFSPFIVLSAKKPRGNDETSKEQAIHHYNNANGNEEVVLCNVAKVFVHYSLDDEEEEYVCERQVGEKNKAMRYRSFSRNDDKQFFNSTSRSISVVKISGIDKSFIEKYDATISLGDAIIAFPSAEIKKEEIIVDADKAVVVNSWIDEASAEVGSFEAAEAKQRNHKDDRKLANNNKGVNTLVFVRVSGMDDEVIYTSEELSRRVFGGHDDSVNIVSQMSACSYDRLKVVPGIGHGLVNGILDMKLMVNVANTESNDLMTMAQALALEIYGLDLSAYTFLMFCIPRSSTHNGRHFLAYSWMNGYRSVFNEKWCDSPSAQMHEAGHLLGLAHSGAKSNNEEYGDVSCYMGYAAQSSEVPRLCYNAAKTYQLGWYDDSTITINPYEDTWSGRLIGYVDYGKSVAVGRETSQYYYVIVEILQRSNMGSNKAVNLYMNFNRKKSFNADNRAYQNEVTLVKGEKNMQSWLITSLKAGGSYKLQNFDSSDLTLIIQVSSIVINDKNEDDIDYAEVHIGFQSCFDNDGTTLTSCDDSDMCTADTCDDQRCRHTSIKCYDDNPCTTDTCDSAQGCIHTSIAGCKTCSQHSDCDDLLFCNGREICNEDLGICQSSPEDGSDGLLPCDDGDFFTNDVCDDGDDKCSHILELTSSSNSATLNIEETVAIYVKSPSYTNSDFTWFVNSTKDSNTSNLGLITPEGYYTAPSALPSYPDLLSVTIHARNTLDETTFGSINLNVKCQSSPDITIKIVRDVDNNTITATDEILYEAIVTNAACTQKTIWSASIGNIISISPTSARYKPPPYLSSIQKIVTITAKSVENKKIKDVILQKVISGCYQVPDKNLILDMSSKAMKPGETITMTAFCAGDDDDEQNNNNSIITWSTTMKSGIIKPTGPYSARLTLPNTLSSNHNKLSSRFRIMATITKKTSEDNTILKIGHNQGFTHTASSDTKCEGTM